MSKPNCDGFVCVGDVDIACNHPVRLWLAPEGATFDHVIGQHGVRYLRVGSVAYGGTERLVYSTAPGQSGVARRDAE